MTGPEVDFEALAESMLELHPKQKAMSEVLSKIPHDASPVERFAAQFDADLAGEIAEKGPDAPDLPFAKKVGDLTFEDITNMALVLGGTIERGINTLSVRGQHVTLSAFLDPDKNKVITGSMHIRRNDSFVNLYSPHVVVRGLHSISAVRPDSSGNFLVASSDGEVTVGTPTDLLTQPQARNFAKAHTVLSPPARKGQ